VTLHKIFLVEFGYMLKRALKKKFRFLPCVCNSPNLLSKYDNFILFSQNMATL
jgi:hypothetical protein